MPRATPKRQRMGVREIERTVFPVHEAFVRSQGCCVPGCWCGPVEFAHQRTAANSGKSDKPHAAYGIPLCRDHHVEQHRGVLTFGRKYHIDLWRIAAGLVSRSPDGKMRESFERLPAHLQGLLYPERIAA
jgi:hypothetical protein